METRGKKLLSQYSVLRKTIRGEEEFMRASGASSNGNKGKIIFSRYSVQRKQLSVLVYFLRPD